MSLAKPLKGWQRQLLKPMGGKTLMLAGVGTVLLLWLSRWPWSLPEPMSVLQDEFRWPILKIWPLNFQDVEFYLAVVLWFLFVLLVLPKRIGRILFVPGEARRAYPVDPATRYRSPLAISAAVLTFTFLIFGWQGRIGRRWIDEFRSLAGNPSWQEPPVNLDREERIAVFSNCFTSFSNRKDRIAALALLTQDLHHESLADFLLKAEASERDPELRLWELRLLSMCRAPATLPLFNARLKDPDPEIRAAAADAIGIYRQPSYSISDAMQLDSEPPLGIADVLNGPFSSSSAISRFRYDDLFGGGPQEVDPSVRSSLQKLLTDGSTQAERDAAARTLVSWPPDRYRLRLAEWGVWIDNNGQMAMARKVLEEIPPFVHRTGNGINTFGDFFDFPIITRLGYFPTVVTKPIIHITADTAMSVDLEVHIRDGRPWFAFPLPSNFGLGLEAEFVMDKPLLVVGSPTTVPSSPGPLDNGTIPPLTDVHYGYPWLNPKHYIYQTDSKGKREIYDIGLQWQSLIVSPTRLAWMKPPAVPADPKFHWWQRLRDVPCSWIASSDESERFLYYDGPTRRQVPLRVSLQPSTNTLTFTPLPYQPVNRADGGSDAFHPLEPTSLNNLPYREGLYIDCAHDGTLRGEHLAIPLKSNPPVELKLPLQGNSVVDELRRMLTEYGLTAPEAEGLIAAWTPQFFKTEGRRFILRMSPEDYARQCPIAVRPTPTEVVRLGLILTEFDVRDSSSAGMRPDKQK